MPNLYIHFPYCNKKCHYCNFYSTASKIHREGFVAALLKEIELRKTLWPGEFESIYIGGGTPSLLLNHEMADILDAIYKNFKIAKNVEITLEANPGNVNPGTLKEWIGQGINRLSIGTQSFNDFELRWLGRTHDAKLSLNSILMAKDAGFVNISADLIFGIPGSSTSILIDNLKWIEDLDIPHLSAYALTVEPNTPLSVFINRGKKSMPDDEFVINSFDLIMQWTSAHGYEQYEISNYAKKGFRSKHNAAYWFGNCYLGLGPGAHSFNGKERRWNLTDVKEYNQSFGNAPFESEVLSETDRFNEYILTRLRTIEGINFKEFSLLFGDESLNNLLVILRPFIENGKVIRTPESVSLSRSGILIADYITLQLIK